MMRLIVTVVVQLAALTLVVLWLSSWIEDDLTLVTAVLLASVGLAFVTIAAAYVGERLGARRRRRAAARPGGVEIVGVVRRCRVCRCTDERGCWPVCWWVEADLCSECDEPSTRGLADPVRGAGGR